MHKFFMFLLLALTLCSCGQKGSLYLPDEPEPAPESPGETTGMDDNGEDDAYTDYDGGTLDE